MSRSPCSDQTVVTCWPVAYRVLSHAPPPPHQTTPSANLPSFTCALADNLTRVVVCRAGAFWHHDCSGPWAVLCSLECTVLAVDDGAGLHTADAPAPAEDNLLKLSESAEVHEGGS